MFRGVYTTKLDLTAVSTARTLVQYNAAATVVGVLLRAWVTQENSETSTQEGIEVLRVTTAGTGTAGVLRPLGAYVAAAGTTTVNHTVEGTASDSLLREGFNILNGWLWVPSCEQERIIIGPSGRLALKFPVAPEAAIDVTAGFVIGEIG